MFEGTDPDHQVINVARRLLRIARVPRRLDKEALESWQISQGFRRRQLQKTKETASDSATPEQHYEEEKDGFFLTSTPI